VHVLLDAFHLLSNAHPDATLRLVVPLDVAAKQFVDPFGLDPLFGKLTDFYARPQSYLDKLQQTARAMGEKVRLEGPVANDAITSHHATAGVFVFPSIWQEPFAFPSSKRWLPVCPWWQPAPAPLRKSSRTLSPAFSSSGATPPPSPQQVPNCYPTQRYGRKWERRAESAYDNASPGTGASRACFELY
jgi:hypothetical protein